MDSLPICDGCQYKYMVDSAHGLHCLYNLSCRRAYEAGKEAGK